MHLKQSLINNLIDPRIFMSYIKKYLSTEEKIIVFERLHWIVFWFPVFLIISLLSSALWLVQSKWISNMYSATASLLSSNQEETINIGQIYETRIVYLLIAGAVFISLKAFIKYISTEAAVTSKRVIFKTGFIRISTLEIRKEKIENIQVKQSILGRILGYGDLTFIGTGGSPVVFKIIQDPVGTKNRIDNYLFK